MNNVVKFPVSTEDTKEELNSMIDFLKEDLDTLFFIKTDTEGNVSLGHSPADTKELVFMYHHILKYIDFLLAGGEEE